MGVRSSGSRAWVVVAFALSVGCSFDRTEHPNRTCETNADCGDGAPTCVHGFCIVNSGGSGGVGGSGGSGGVGGSGGNGGVGGSGGIGGSGECTRNATRVCYDGPLGTEGIGVCTLGIQTCDGTVWGDCVDDRAPSPETCVNASFDDDCNGVIDDVLGEGDICTDEAMLGECRIGTRQCQGGRLHCITPEPTPEVCDDGQRDEDCDSDVNEGFDLTSDDNNCGSCGNACTRGESCCGGRCRDLSTDHASCGACNNNCGPIETCCQGQCRRVSSDSDKNDPCDCEDDCGEQTCCEEDCVDLLTDDNNCGGCDIRCRRRGGLDLRHCCNGECTNNILCFTP